MFLEDKLGKFDQPKDQIAETKKFLSKLGGKTIPAFDEERNLISIYIAKSTDKYEKGYKIVDGKKIVSKKLVNQDLIYRNGSKVKDETLFLIDEVLTTALPKEFGVDSDHTHGWVDNYGKNKWDYWTTHVIDTDGKIYDITLSVDNDKFGRKVLYSIDVNDTKKQGLH